MSIQPSLQHMADSAAFVRYPHAALYAIYDLYELHRFCGAAHVARPAAVKYAAEITANTCCGVLLAWLQWPAHIGWTVGLLEATGRRVSEQQDLILLHQQLSCSLFQMHAVRLCGCHSRANHGHASRVWSLCCHRVGGF
jgi:hypothetical protein